MKQDPAQQWEREVHLALASSGSTEECRGAGMGSLFAPASLTYQQLMEMGLFRAQGLAARRPDRVLLRE